MTSKQPYLYKEIFSGFSNSQSPALVEVGSKDRVEETVLFWKLSPPSLYLELSLSGDFIKCIFKGKFI
jgi:hypothetical protein